VENHVDNGHGDIPVDNRVPPRFDTHRLSTAAVP